jgi:hypothetical protein
MTSPGSANNPEWVELDLDGKLQGRWKLGPKHVADPVTHNLLHDIEGFAFTADGRLFANEMSCLAPHQCSETLVLLDRNTSTWKAVDDNPINHFRNLIGADGNEVVLWDRSQANSSGVHLLWFQPGQPR